MTQSPRCPQVGNNFNSPNTQLYLSQFASRPSSEFVKVLDSFEKLRGLFREQQAKIYDIEGAPPPPNHLPVPAPKKIWGSQKSPPSFPQAPATRTASTSSSPPAASASPPST